MGSSQRSPRPLAGFKGSLLLMERDGRKFERRGGKRGEEKGKGKEEKRRGGKGRGREWTPQGFCEMTPLEIHQIKFRLGLHPIHRWGAYDAHPDSPVDWKEVHSSSDFPLLNAFGFSISGPLVCWSSATFFPQFKH